MPAPSLAAQMRTAAAEKIGGFQNFLLRFPEGFVGSLGGGARRVHAARTATVRCRGGARVP
jgi:hypothetical protein